MTYKIIRTITQNFCLLKFYPHSSCYPLSPPAKPNCLHLSKTNTPKFTKPGSSKKLNAATRNIVEFNASETLSVR